MKILSIICIPFRIFIMTLVSFMAVIGLLVVTLVTLILYPQNLKELGIDTKGAIMDGFKWIINP